MGEREAAGGWLALAVWMLWVQVWTRQPGVLLMEELRSVGKAGQPWGQGGGKLRRKESSYSGFYLQSSGIGFLSPDDDTSDV